MKVPRPPPSAGTAVLVTITQGVWPKLSWCPGGVVKFVNQVALEWE